MTTTALSICQSGMTRIGALPITSFNDGTAEALVADHSYHLVKRAVLTMYPWRCAMETRQLAELATPPHPPWLHAWQKPADALKVWNVRDKTGGCSLTFDQQGTKLLTTEAGPLIVDYTFDVGEAYLEPHIVELLALRMASVFATGVADRTSMAQELRDEMDFFFRFAKAADSQGRTPNTIELGRYRRGRG